MSTNSDFDDVMSIARGNLHVCPQCASGTLVKAKQLNDDHELVREFWTCDHDPVCRYQADDYRGAPLGKHSCPTCGRALRLVTSKLESFWGCEGWFDPHNSCQTSFDNVAGAPVTRAPVVQPTPVKARKGCVYAGA